METTTQDQIAALKESITSDAAIETERMTIRRIPTVLSDVYFSKCCTIFYLFISVSCVVLLIVCCCLFQHANGNLLIRLHMVFVHWRGTECDIHVWRGVQHNNAESQKLLQEQNERNNLYSSDHIFNVGALEYTMYMHYKTSKIRM
jgi:hypothetical protein